MRRIRMSLVLLGLLTAVLTVPAASAWYEDGNCWDTGDGRGCHWAEGNGWYYCGFFGGAYTESGFYAGAALCPSGADARVVVPY